MANFIEDKIGSLEKTSTGAGSSAGSTVDLLGTLTQKVEDLMKVKQEVEKISLQLEPLLSNGNILSKILEAAQKQGEIDAKFDRIEKANSELLQKFEERIKE